MTLKPIHVARAASLVIFISAIGSIFAVLREALVAARLGVSVQTDAYFFAYTFVVSLPYFIMDAIKKSLSPIYIHSNAEEKRALVNSIMTLHILFYGGLVILVIAIINFFPNYFLGGFDPKDRSLVVQIAEMLSPAILAIGLWGLIRILLEAEGMFFAAAISDIFLAIFVIASILLTGHQLGVYSLPAGIVLASMAQFAWVAFWLWRRGVHFRLTFNFNHPGLRRFLTLFWPPLIAAFLGYAIPIIDREIASHLSQGTISSLSYAEKIVVNLQGIVIIPLNNVLLPSLARQSKAANQVEFKESIVRTLGLIVFMLTPVSILLSELRMPLIQLFYQRGEFDAAAVAQTGSIYQFLVLCLMPMACATTLETVFSSMEDTRTGSFVGVGTKFTSKIIFNLVLVSLFGAVGLGLAAPLMYVASGGLLFIILWRRLQGLDAKRLISTLIKTLVAALAAVLPLSFFASQLGLPELVKAAALVFFAPILFLILAAVLQIPELHWGYAFLIKAKQYLVKRFGVPELADTTNGK